MLAQEVGVGPPFGDDAAGACQFGLPVEARRVVEQHKLEDHGRVPSVSSRNAQSAYPGPRGREDSPVAAALGPGYSHSANSGMTAATTQSHGPRRKAV